MVREVVSELVEGKQPRVKNASSTYFTTLVHSLNKLKVKDKVVWN